MSLTRSDLSCPMPHASCLMPHPFQRNQSTGPSSSSRLRACPERSEGMTGAWLCHYSFMRVWSVSDLLRQINLDLFRYNDIAVEGEVTNLTRSSAGHCYFSIKDARAQM